MHQFIKRPEPTAATRHHPTIRTRRELAQHFSALGFRRGAEIGVADGRFSLVLCQAIPDLELLCVDPWQRYRENPRGGPQTQHDGNHQLARERLAPYKATLVQAMSVDAVRGVADGSLDFCFLDGHHGFDWIMLDLILWSRKVRSGGICSGHDFYHFSHAGVVAAVNAYTEAHEITDWHVTYEREPSFWWVKDA